MYTRCPDGGYKRTASGAARHCNCEANTNPCADGCCQYWYLLYVTPGVQTNMGFSIYTADKTVIITPDEYGDATLPTAYSEFQCPYESVITRDVDGYWWFTPTEGVTFRSRGTSSNCPPLTETDWICTDYPDLTALPIFSHCYPTAPDAAFPHTALLITGLERLDFTATNGTFVSSSPTYTTVSSLVLDTYSGGAMYNGSAFSWELPAHPGFYINVPALTWSFYCDPWYGATLDLVGLGHAYKTYGATNWYDPLCVVQSSAICGAGTVTLPISVSVGEVP